MDTAQARREEILSLIVEAARKLSEELPPERSPWEPPPEELSGELSQEKGSGKSPLDHAITSPFARDYDEDYRRWKKWARTRTFKPLTSFD